MPFRVQDYQDLIRLLSEHPEWREQLRRQLLSDDFLALPGIVRGLTEAQRQTEQQLRELAEAQRQTEQIVHVLADRQGQMRGELLEMKYTRRAAAYFGRLLRRIRTVLPGQLEVAMEDSLEQHLTEDELAEVFQLDLLVVGRLREPEAQEVWLAVEVSAVIDRSDVERAQRRAALLRKAGYRVVPVVAGEGLTQGATELLQDAPVAPVLNGRSQGWQEALTAA
ncbi:MAG: hypothetical protein ACE5ID_03820 [Acidobacteriota bacterium]